MNTWISKNKSIFLLQLMAAASVLVLSASFICRLKNTFSGSTTSIKQPQPCSEYIQIGSSTCPGRQVCLPNGAVVKQIKVYQQEDDNSCGFHSMRNVTKILNCLSCEGQDLCEQLYNRNEITNTIGSLERPGTWRGVVIDCHRREREMYGDYFDDCELPDGAGTGQYDLAALRKQFDLFKDICIVMDTTALNAPKRCLDQFDRQEINTMHKRLKSMPYRCGLVLADLPLVADNNPLCLDENIECDGHCIAAVINRSEGNREYIFADSENEDLLTGKEKMVVDVIEYFEGKEMAQSFARRA
jgi:hypothetical protein